MLTYIPGIVTLIVSYFSAVYAPYFFLYGSSRCLLVKAYIMEFVAPHTLLYLADGAVVHSIVNHQCHNVMMYASLCSIPDSAAMHTIQHRQYHCNLQQCLTTSS